MHWRTGISDSCANKWGQVHPHRQDIVRVWVHIHSQGKLHIWCLNIVNSGAVHRLYDGPNLRERQVEGEAWNLKKEKKGKELMHFMPALMMHRPVHSGENRLMAKDMIHKSDLPWCLPAGSATHGGALQPSPARCSPPIWAGNASGC